MKFVNVLSFSFLMFLFAVSCDTSEPPQQSELLLKLEDVSCTEAWLQLTSTNIQIPNNINLLINGSFKKTFTLNSKDSLLYIDSLLPNQTYKILATMQQGNNASNELSITTLDTTSHNFSWQTFTFGGSSSSGLFDIAIIDENNIWAVGEIYMNDSLGNPDSKRYNAVIWDGTKWSVIRIPYFFQGQPFYNPIQSVFAFSQNDIWFCGNGVVHWDGNNFIPIPIPANVWGPYQMNKIWGSSSNDLYVVGNSGNIAHYNGTNWQRIESGTTTDIASIYGCSKLINTEVICLSSNPYTTEETKLFRLNNNIAEELPQLGLQWGMSDLWFVSNKKHYVVGNGIHIKKDVNSSIESWQKITNPPPANYYSCAIDGQSFNDIIMSGASGEVVHFNGYSWKNYRLEIGLMFGLLEECKIGKNIVVAVGYDGVNAIIVVGKRN